MKGSDGQNWPERVGPCRLLRPLGRGAQAEVVLAELEREVEGLHVGETVALKLPLAEAAAPDASLARLERELRLTRRVRHDGVVRAHAAGADEAGGAPQPWLILELVEGRTFGELIEEMGRLPEALLRALAMRAAEALAAVHAAGLVHRDLKASNFVLTEVHELKLIDLGLALDLHAQGPASSDFVGTPSHAAPELFEGAVATQAADRHALGVLLYQAASGQLPFGAESFEEMARRRLGAEAPALSLLVPEVSDFLEELVATLLSSRPEARFADTDELAITLRKGEASEWWQRRLRATTGGRRAWWASRPVDDLPLVGRSSELGALRSAFEAAQQGAGGAVLLVGEAGLGKSRLLLELVRELEAGDAELLGLHGASPPSGSLGVPGPVGRSLVQRFGRQQLHAAIAERVEGAPELRAHLVDRLLRRDSVASGSVAAGLDRLLASLCSEGTVLWLLEDLHDADEDAIELVLALAAAAHERSALLVLATRPGRVADRLRSALPAAAQVELSPIPELVRELLAARLDDETIAGELAPAASRLTGGSPLHVLELADALVADGLLSRDAAGRWSVSSEWESAASLAELIGRRRDRLASAERELLECAALDGDAIDAETLARALGRESLEVVESLARVERRSRLLRSAGGSEGFDHPLTREVLRDAVPEQRRERLHARLADAHEGAPEPRVATVVAHRLRAGDLTRARPQLVPVLEALDRSCAHSELLDLSSRALESLGEGDRALASRLHSLRASAHALLGDVAERTKEQEAAVREAKQAGDAELLRARQRELAVLAWETGDADRAQELAAQVAAEAREAGDADVERRARVLLGRVHLQAGRLEEARQAHERALELAREVADRDAEAEVLGHLGAVLFRLRDLEGAREAAQRTLEHWRERGDRFREAYSLEALGAALNELGDREAARNCHEQAFELFGQLGHSVGEAGVAMSLANDLLQLGRPADALEVSERGLALARRIERVDLECGLLINVALAALDCGKAQAAVDDLGRAIELMQGRGFEPWRAYALTCLGRARQRSGDEDGALAAAREGLEVQRQLGVESETGKALLALGMVQLRAGRKDEARETLEEAATLVSGDAAELDDPPPPIGLAALGVLESRGVAVPKGLAPLVRAECHALLHRAGAPRQLSRAWNLVDAVASALPERLRASYWSSPVPAAVREAVGRRLGTSTQEK